MLGKYFTLEFQFTDEIITYSGYLIDYNDNWVLLKFNPADYVVDGYVLLRNKYVIRYKRGDKERFAQKVLDRKGAKPKWNERIPIGDIKTTLKHLSSHYGLFVFHQRTHKACWLGKVKKITGEQLKITYLDPRANWSSTMPPYRLGNIRTIEIDTDYNNSLKLVAKK